MNKQDFAMLIESIKQAGEIKRDLLTYTAYLQERAKRGSHEQYLAALAQVPDVEPEAYDRFEASVPTAA